MLTRGTDPEPTPGTRRHSRGRYYVLGLLLALLTFTVAAISTMAYGLLHSHHQLPTHTIVYSVSGTARDASVVFSGSSTTVDRVALPWHRDVPVTGTVGWLTFSVVVGPSGGTVACRITVDGQVVATNSQSGPQATATCENF